MTYAFSTLSKRKQTEEEEKREVGHANYQEGQGQSKVIQKYRDTNKAMPPSKKLMLEPGFRVHVAAAGTATGASLQPDLATQ